MSVSARLALFRICDGHSRGCRLPGQSPPLRQRQSCDKARQHFPCRDETAVERRGRASKHRGAGYELGPFAARKSVVETVTGTAGENIRERLVRGGKDRNGVSAPL